MGRLLEAAWQTSARGTGLAFRYDGCHRNLGATGLRGWIHTKAANNLDAAQGRTTLASRQILVTHVGAASPADEVVLVDDVIVGVDGKPFGDSKGLIKLANNGDPHQIQGACEALGLINTAEALPVLVKQLAHPDRWVPYKAAEAVRKMGGAANDHPTLRSTTSASKR